MTMQGDSIALIADTQSGSPGPEDRGDGLSWGTGNEDRRRNCMRQTF